MRTPVNSHELPFAFADTNIRLIWLIAVKLGGYHVKHYTFISINQLGNCFNRFGYYFDCSCGLSILFKRTVDLMNVQTKGQLI
jgi:hypothetical protein